MILKYAKKSSSYGRNKNCKKFNGVRDQDVRNNSPKANMRKAIEYLLKHQQLWLPILELVKVKNLYSQTKNYLIQKNFTRLVKFQKKIVKAFDVSMILYAEHSFNVSTFTARTITSSL